MATLPIQQQRWQEIPAYGKQLLLVPLNDTYPMNYFNQNYHKLFNLQPSERTQLNRWNYGASKMQSTTHQLMENNTNRRSFLHHMATKILFTSTLSLSTYYPTINLYLCERLSNSLLKIPNIVLMQVYNANILNPMGMLYNAITL